MGTIPCGKRVLQLLRGQDVFESKMLRLEKRWQVGSVGSWAGLGVSLGLASTGLHRASTLLLCSKSYILH